ncbi:MAG: fibronectin type III domain-containing protein [bacterium]
MKNLVFISLTLVLGSISPITAQLFFDENVGSILAETYDLDQTDSVEELVASYLPPPEDINVTAISEDGALSVFLKWSAPASELSPSGYVVEIQSDDGIWKNAGKTEAEEWFIDNLDPDIGYLFRIAAEYQGDLAYSEAIEPILVERWFKFDEIPVLVSIILFTILLVGFIYAARKGMHLFVRRIPGLTAVEDAIGRATEMGRPVLYVPGIGTIEDVATLASLNILGEICRRTVNYDVRIICPNNDPIVFSIAQEIVKEAYSSEGRPDMYDPNQVFYLVPDQFAYAAGVNGIMVREKPATIFLLGWFMAESLIMAETGAMTGAIQIGGTDEVSQLPFFVTACDYTLVGEELYAASAYLGRQPMLLGTLKAQDYSKLVFLLLMVIFSIIALITGWNTSEWIMVR